MPQVSVIIPAYNPGTLLERSLGSVLAQTFADFEVIIVDDGGREDLTWVTSADDRVRLIRQENRGVSVARNVGAAAAVGEHLAFLDQDDEWTLDKLAHQTEAIASAPPASVVHSEFVWVLRGGADKPGVYVRPVTYHGLLDDQHVCLSSVLLSRDTYLAAGGFSPVYSYMQDYDLFLRLAMTNVFVCVREPLVRYYLHEANASRDYVNGEAERRELLCAHQRTARRRGDTATVDAARRGLCQTRRLFGAQAYDALRESVRARSPAAVAHLARSLRWNPRYTIKSLLGTAALHLR